MARAIDVADYIIKTAISERKPISDLKLQKIMYFLNTEYLLEYNKNLITDESFEKWPYGPVIRQVYNVCSKFGSQNIKDIPVYNYIDSNNNLRTYHFDEKNIDSKDKEFIKQHINNFIDLDAFFLVRKTHEENQWIDKSSPLYDNKKTIDYYKCKEHRFWEQ